MQRTETQPQAPSPAAQPEPPRAPLPPQAHRLIARLQRALQQ